MRRHPFDPISLVCGLLFVTAGTIVLLGGSLAEEGAFLAPAGLIALGLAFLHQARRRASQARRPAADDATGGCLTADDGGPGDPHGVGDVGLADHDGTARTPDIDGTGAGGGGESRGPGVEVDDRAGGA